MIFYHNTTDNNADAILADGFRDASNALGEGVWFTDNPDYMGNEAQLSIDIPTEVMALYRVEYEDRPDIRKLSVPIYYQGGSRYCGAGSIVIQPDARRAFDPVLPRRASGCMNCNNRISVYRWLQSLTAHQWQINLLDYIHEVIDIDFWIAQTHGFGKVRRVDGIVSIHGIRSMTVSGDHVG